jgi:DNA-directed RNA polymerase specialized sigma24 family protein
MQMMDESGTDAEELLLRWRQGQLHGRVLYTAVRGPMYQAARSGISSITSSDPDPQDVEDAVYEAFVQLSDKDPADVSSVTGLAKVIARRRGQDIGRKVVREREQIEELLINPLAMAAAEFRDQDVRAAEEDEKVLAAARVCIERLTQEQRDLVTKTIMGQEQLSDWALSKGTSHQAASRQRRRAIEAIKRCIASKRNKVTTGRQVTP